MKTTLFLATFALAATTSAPAADYPQPVQGDYTLHDFRFASGETLPEVRMHYRTLGKRQADEKGVIRNAVLMRFRPRR